MQFKLSCQFKVYGGAPLGFPSKVQAIFRQCIITDFRFSIRGFSGKIECCQILIWYRYFSKLPSFAFPSGWKISTLKQYFPPFPRGFFLHHHELCKMLRLFCPFTTVKFSAILGLFSRQVAKDMQKRRLFGLLLAFSKLSTLKTMHFVVLLSSFQIEYLTSNQASSHFGNNSGWMDA